MNPCYSVDLNNIKGARVGEACLKELKQFGYMGDYRLNGQKVANVFGNPVPWFRSGSSEYGTYLALES